MIKKKNILVIFFFFFYFILGVSIYKNYGLDVEEVFSRVNGLYWLGYILEKLNYINEVNKINDLISLSYNKDVYLPPIDIYKIQYGPFFEIISALLEIKLNITETKIIYETRHLINFSIFFLSSIFFYKILQNRFKSDLISLFGLLFYILNPRIFGNSFHNPKDIIFLSVITLSIYFLFKNLEKKKIKNIIFFSFFSGLAISIRIIGIFIPIIFIFLLLINFNKKKIFLAILYVFFLFFFLILLWPFLWENPFVNFINFLFNYKNQVWNVQTLFNGNYLYIHYLPDHYLTFWLCISNPIYYLIIFLLGLIFLTLRFFKKLLNLSKRNYHFLTGLNEKKDFFFFFCFLSILLFIIFFKVPFNGSWRYFYFLNIFLGYISTYFIYLLLLNTKKKFFKFLVFIPFIFVVIKIYHFHPYESVYFNEIIKNKNLFQRDHYILGATDALRKIIKIDKNAKINVSNISDEPLYRFSNMLSENEKKKLTFIGNDYLNSDYIFNSFNYAKNPFHEKKYKLPNNFEFFFNLNIDGVQIYEVYKKKNK